MPLSTPQTKHGACQETDGGQFLMTENTACTFLVYTAPIEGAVAYGWQRLEAIPRTTKLSPLLYSVTKWHRWRTVYLGSLCLSRFRPQSLSTALRLWMRWNILVALQTWRTCLNISLRGTCSVTSSSLHWPHLLPFPEVQQWHQLEARPSVHEPLGTFTSWTTTSFEILRLDQQML